MYNGPLGGLGHLVPPVSVGRRFFEVRMCVLRHNFLVEFIDMGHMLLARRVNLGQDEIVMLLEKNTLESYNKAWYSCFFIIDMDEKSFILCFEIFWILV